MNINAVISINTKKIVHETIDGETVILNLDNGNYYSLVEVGACIWGYIENSVSTKDIIDKLRSSYECDGEDIEAAVNEFTSELMKESLAFFDETNNPGSVQGAFGQIETNSNGKKQRFDAPVLNKYSDMKDLLLLDPIHEVDEKAGWPTNKPELTNP